jgi:hypothetical protein
MVYKVNITNRNRVFVVIACCVLAIISLLFGYLSSYLNRASCVSSYCGVMFAYGLHYSNYNSSIVILLPVFALILNIFTYIGAKRLGIHADMKKELKLILITLIITSVDVTMITVPNIIQALSYNKVFTSGSWFSYLFICYCCNSIVNLFVYICLKRDFRNHLLMSISFGRLKNYLNIPTDKIVRPTQRIARVAPSKRSGIPIRSSVGQTMPSIID